MAIATKKHNNSIVTYQQKVMRILALTKLLLFSEEGFNQRAGNTNRFPSAR
jgi:hypothetical protein